MDGFWRMATFHITRHVQRKKIFFLLYLLYNYGISYQLYINNIENSNRFFGRLFSTMD